MDGGEYNMNKEEKTLSFAKNSKLNYKKIMIILITFSDQYLVLTGFIVLSHLSGYL